jgi:prepilin-type N-terminal cleavage/methylation domain-containing protein
MRHTGFSLIEMAVVLVLVGLVLTSVLGLVSGQQGVAELRTTRQYLSDAREALVGYALSRPGTLAFLPCPDTNGDGLEEARVVNACPQQEGWLPFATLGLTRTDAWSSRVRYRVDARFSTGTGMTLAATANLRVCTAPACATVLAAGIPVVLVSHGKNAAGARGDTFVLSPAATLAEELENTNGRNVSDTLTNACPLAPVVPTAPCTFVANAPLDAFDDVVEWLSADLLKSRLVAAGKPLL